MEPGCSPERGPLASEEYLPKAKKFDGDDKNGAWTPASIVRLSQGDIQNHSKESGYPGGGHDRDAGVKDRGSVDEPLDADTSLWT